MIHPPAPPTNVALRSVFEAVCLLSILVLLVTAVAANAPWLLVVGPIACGAVFLAGVRRVTIQRRTYAVVARVAAVCAHLMTTAILTVLHRVVVRGGRGTIRDSRFVRSSSPGTVSFWSVGNYVELGSSVPEHARAPAAGPARVTPSLRSWIAWRQHSWAMPIYPYVVLLNFYREPAQGQPGMIPTQTYTLF